MPVSSGIFTAAGPATAAGGSRDTSKEGVDGERAESEEDEGSRRGEGIDGGIGRREKRPGECVWRNRGIG